jgi:hypothetical protein
VSAFSRTRSLSSSAWNVARSTAAGRLGALVALAAGPPMSVDSCFMFSAMTALPRSPTRVRARGGARTRPATKFAWSYLDKYEATITGPLGTTLDEIDRTYNTEIRIRPTRVRLTDTSV